MNLAQRISVLVGCGVIAVIGIYPPWHSTTPATRWGTVEIPSGYRSLGYAPLWAPPMRIDIWKPVSFAGGPSSEAPPSDEFERLLAAGAKIREQKAWEEARYGRHATVDLARLVVQWIAVTSTTLGLTILIGALRLSSAKKAIPRMATTVAETS